jgi:hypothetical protein
MYLIKILDQRSGHFLTKFSLYFGKEYNSIKGANRMDMRMENDNHIHNPKRMSYSYPARIVHETYIEHTTFMKMKSKRNILPLIQGIIWRIHHKYQASKTIQPFPQGSSKSISLPISNSQLLFLMHSIPPFEIDITLW